MRTTLVRARVRISVQFFSPPATYQQGWSCLLTPPADETAREWAEWLYWQIRRFVFTERDNAAIRGA